ncbi:zinc finger MYM-type protein 1-like [Cynara cardunculus var. scolymus]|uniref:zinc finger MYM-type protein 1-like n=1 Tax=Cynara cardunculus var. scolymus TaxID=59895 RepID=UPI000D628D5B|nr:zinc finger MYM-type protein 1-like [Cynara cardunculus var. scolymus]
MEVDNLLVSMEVHLNDLPWDPSERKRISEYHPNLRDEIRRKYLIRGPCQPRNHDFPRKMIGKNARRFCPTWYDRYGNWLEYSVKADKAFCLCCYLFRDQFGKQGGTDAFVTEGFNSWNKTERLGLHVGNFNSFHNRALKKCEDLMRPDRSIVAVFHRQSNIVNNEYRVRLNASVDAARYLLNDDLANTLRDGLMVVPSIQKDIVCCFAQEVLKPVLEEIGDDVFALLVDESHDISRKEQMVVVLRYVTSGIVKERFVGLLHVMGTNALSLKSAIESLFFEYGLSLKKVRGQSYDGVMNVCGEFNGLKALILRENSAAYYVHCFAHQLQLVVLAVAKTHLGVGNFFDMMDVVMNVVCSSCKQIDDIRESQKEKVNEAMGSGEIEGGSGLNQERSLVRLGDARLGSYYKTLLSLVDFFPSIVDVLEYVEEAGDNTISQRQANALQIYFKSFDFVFYLHLMLHILEVTDLLSQALQRKDENILNVISLVKSTKQQLQKLRVDGFCSLLKKLSSFCEKHDIEMLNMEEAYVNPRHRRQKTNISNGHYYEFDCFNTIVDILIQEFDDRFNEVSFELLTCMAALNPHNSFCAFDPSKLLRLTEFYKDDFSRLEIMTFEHELNLYIHNVQQDGRFANLKGISELARMMVETRKHLSFTLIYRLLKLALVLPVATPTIDRCFYSMKLVKSDMCNRIGDDFLNDCGICAVQKEQLAKVTDEDVMDRYQKMKIR